MRLRRSFFVAAALIATPALAHDHAPPGAMPPDARGLPDTRPEWRGPPPPHMMGAPMGYGQVDPRAREDWLVECRRRLSANDRGLGGAAIGGVVGGVLGNRIAGPGDRAVGTIAGAAVGAVAGAAIDKAEDRGRIRDECERILADHEARAPGYGYGAGYGYPAPGYPAAYGYPAYGVPMMMVPVMMMPQGRENCREVVTYQYERVPVRRRHIHRAPDKRVRIVPDKRVRTD